jgi:hypothetical protein
LLTAAAAASPNKGSVALTTRTSQTLPSFLETRKIRMLPYSIIAGFDPEHDVEHVLIEDLQYLGRPILDAPYARCVIEDAGDVVFN